MGICAYGQTPPQPDQADSLFQAGAFVEAGEAYQALAERWAQLAGQQDSALYYRLREVMALARSQDFERVLAQVQPLIAEIWRYDSTLSFLGNAYYEYGSSLVFSGQYADAQRVLEQGLLISSASSAIDTLNLARTHEFLGISLMEQGVLDRGMREALESHRLRMLQRGPGHKDVGYSFNSLYVLYDRQGQAKKADSCLTRAWEILNKQLPAGHPHLSILANNLSNLRKESGDPQAARDLLLRAMAENQAGKRYYPLMFDYFNLAGLYLSLDEPETAQPYFFRSLALADSILPYPHKDRTYVLDGLGALANFIEDFALADSVFRLALKEKIDLYGPVHIEVAQSLYNLGIIARGLHRDREALRYFEQSERMRVQTLGRDHPQRADALFEVGAYRWQAGQQAQALLLFRECMAIYTSHLGWTHNYVRQVALEMARRFEEIGQTDSVERYLLLAWTSACGQTVPLTSMEQLYAQEIRYRDPEVMDLLTFHLHYLLDKPAPLSAEDLRLGQQIIALSDQLIGRLSPLYHYENGGRSLVEQAKNVYGYGAQLAHRGLESGPDTALQSLLLNCLERSRSVTIRSALRNRQALQFAGVPDSLVDRDRALRDQLRRLQATEEGNDNTAALAAWEEWQAYQRDLATDFPTYFAFRFAESKPDLAVVQRSLTGETSHLVGYFYQDGSLLAMVATADQLRTVALPVQPGWEDSLAVFQTQLAAGSSRPRIAALAHSLYLQLWAPLDIPANAGVEVIPDGPLYALNVETLLRTPVDASSPYREWPWLLRSQRIHYANSLPTASPAQRSARAAAVLGIAPGFTPELKAAYQTQLPPNIQPDSTFLGWIRTPWSVAFVQSLATNHWGQSLIGTDANESQFRRLAPTADVLHFGTHARLNDAQPLRSYLALTPVPDAADDGYLYTYELYNQPLKAQLAVLTACETGAGSYRSGEGVLSLAHAFQYAGCPSVIYSLWSVDDQQTNVLIEAFYRQLGTGQSTAEALRAAKLAYLDSQEGALQSPYYWGGLVLTGENPVLEKPGAGAGAGMGWVAGLLLGVVIAGGGYWGWKRRGESGG